jgi:hypothetical protein
MIAGKLDKKLRDHLKLSRTQLFREGMSATGSFQRPLLVLVDRHVDIPTMLHHTCTYQALTHDVLDYKLNRVAYVVEDSGEDGKVRCLARRGKSLSDPPQLTNPLPPPRHLLVRVHR